MADEIDLANERAQLHTDNAIQRVRSRLTGKPSDGICKSCQEPIEPERLEVIPTAVHCIDCASFLEKSKRRA